MPDVGTQSELTIGRILKDLPPGQLWSILVAIVTLLGGAFAFGQQMKAWKSPTQASVSMPVHCASATNWPLGTWLAWGHIDSDWKPTKEKDTFPQIVSSVVFDSKETYEASTDHKVNDTTKNKLRATLESPLKAGAPFFAIGKDGTGYRAEVTGQVTLDGCMIDGDFRDSAGNRGSLHYLFKRNEYFVLP